MTFDSRPSTKAHIDWVRRGLREFIDALERRGDAHDASKLEPPEVEVFDELMPKYADARYDSPEYQQCLVEMGPALAHHYAANRHHPEHFDDGYRGMNLIDVVEMLCDWRAATIKQTGGDLERSITMNAHRYGYGVEFEGLLRNTARDLGWI